MIYTAEALVMMLARSGGAVHRIDGDDLFCRIKAMEVQPDEYGRVLLERRELSYITGQTQPRSARQTAIIDGEIWILVGVREKISGITAWTIERNLA